MDAGRVMRCSVLRGLPVVVALAVLGSSAHLAPRGGRPVSEPPPPREPAAGRAARAPHQAPGAWAIVALPDTQHYAAQPELTHHFEAQTRWIAANLARPAVLAAPRDIAFVSHLGDIVDAGGSTEQWARADAAMALLDGDPARHPQGLVPYAAVIGNHDYMVVHDRRSGSALYRQHFGARRYQARPDGRSYAWYLGSSPDGLGHAQRFAAGGYDFLHLALPWEVAGRPDDPASALGWARALLAAHPHLPTLLTTHSYLWDQPGAEGRTPLPQSEGGNGAESIFRALVRPFPQVFLVMGGHWHLSSGADDGELHQLDRNVAGLPVYELLADYQDHPEGGQGWLRILDFLPGDGPGGRDRIAVSTFSPSLGHDAAWQVDARSDFAFDLDFEQRFRLALAGRPARPARPVLGLPGLSARPADPALEDRAPAPRSGLPLASPDRPRRLR